MTDEWNDGDDPRVRGAFGHQLRAHVSYQDGAHSEAPTLIFGDADYEVGDGKTGLWEDGKSANEPAIVYCRADAFLALAAERDALRAEMAEGSFYKEADIDALMNERDALREALVEARRMVDEAMCAPATAERWLERIDEVAHDALALSTGAKP